MISRKDSRSRGRFANRIPFAMQMLELVVALVVFSAFQITAAVLAGADPDTTPPSVPASLQVSGRSATEIDLSWAPSTDDTAVSGYNVYRSGIKIASQPTPGYSDTGLTPGTVYSYSVTAYDAAGNESAPSSPVSTNTLNDTQPPSVPSNVHQTASTTNSVTIAWDASSDNVGVAGYNIYRNGTLIKSQTATTFSDSGLAVYTGYNYNIAAYDAANNGSNLSTTFEASTSQDATPPTVPDNLTETGQTVSSITIDWDASSDNVGVAGYHVYRNGSLIASTGGTSYMDSGLIVSSGYSYAVSAYDAAGNVSSQSAPFNARSSDDTTPPSVPINLAVTSDLDTAISFSWSPSTDNVGVVGYKVYRNGNLLGTTTATSYADSGLTPVTGYSYTVEAYDAANNTSTASQALAATTAFDTTPPSVPSNVAATAQTDQTITLSWTASTDNVGVTGYDIYRNGSLLSSTTGTTYTDTGLSVSTSYSYTVRAHDGSGNNSAQSTSLGAATIADLIAPTTPTGLLSSFQTTTSISLSWNASSDDVGVTGYRLYRDGVLLTTLPGSSYNYTDSGLTYNHSYSYGVSAIDNAGNESPQSAVSLVMTLPDTTPPVVDLSAPTAGQTISLFVPLSATASDDLALKSVSFYIDSTLISTITLAPFAVNWNSYQVHNGGHVLSAVATDASGNSATSSVSVTVANPPPALEGDLNGDHKVNILDLSIFLSHWGKPGLGDFNNNGRVDIFDLSVLLSHYGQDDSNYQ